MSNTSPEAAKIRALKSENKKLQRKLSLLQKKLSDKEEAFNQAITERLSKIPMSPHKVDSLEKRLTAAEDTMREQGEAISVIDDIFRWLGATKRSRYLAVRGYKLVLVSDPKGNLDPELAIIGEGDMKEGIRAAFDRAGEDLLDKL